MIKSLYTIIAFEVTGIERHPQLTDLQIISVCTFHCQPSLLDALKLGPDTSNTLMYKLNYTLKLHKRVHVCKTAIYNTELKITTEIKCKLRLLADAQLKV